jgi:SAM-dependent methyltransferase
VGVVGVDVSTEFVRLGSAGGGAFVRGDARRLPFAAGAFDVVLSLCQGGFGLLQGDDGAALAAMANALCPGGVLALTAFSSYFAVRYLEESDAFDASTGVNHERTTVRNEVGEERDCDLWTTCFTPRELSLLAERSGLVVRAIWSVAPGAYARRTPDLEHPELFLVAERAGATMPRR